MPEILIGIRGRAGRSLPERGAGPNLLDMTPVREVEWEEDESGIVTLVRTVRTFWVFPSREQVAKWSAQSDLLEQVETWAVRNMTLSGSGDPREVLVANVRPGMHSFLGRWPEIGREASRRFAIRAQELRSERT